MVNKLGDAFFQHLLAPALNYIERGLTLQQDVVLRIGCGVKEYWYLSAALSVAKGQMPQANTLRRVQSEEAVGRVATLYYRIVAFQDYTILGSGNVSVFVDEMLENRAHEACFQIEGANTTAVVQTNGALSIPAHDGHVVVCIHLCSTVRLFTPR